MKKKYTGKNAEFGNRLKKIREFLKISQKDFAAKLEIAQSFISSVEAQDVHPGFAFFMTLYEKFKISPNYIFLGKGPMFLTGLEEPENEINFGNQTESMLKLMPYLKGSEIVRIAIINFATRFISSNKYVVEMDIKTGESMDSQGETE